MHKRSKIMKVKILWLIFRTYVFSDTRFWQFIQFLEQESIKSVRGDLFYVEDNRSLYHMKQIIKNM